MILIFVLSVNDTPDRGGNVAERIQNTIWFGLLPFTRFIELSHTLLHELHTPGWGQKPGVMGPIFLYVVAEVFLPK